MENGTSDDSPATGLVGRIAAAAVELAQAPAPEAGPVAMAEAEELLAAVGHLNVAINNRIQRVDGTGQARAVGKASTTAWLTAGSRMSRGEAARRRRMGRQLARLPRTADKVACGAITEAQTQAICDAARVLDDDADATALEDILLPLATSGKAGLAELARLGAYLHQCLDPDGHLTESEKAYAKRHLSVRNEADGGVSGFYYLPPAEAEKLRSLLTKHGAKAGDGDDRTQPQRNADVLIGLLDQAVSAELIILFNAESLPDDLPARVPWESSSETDAAGAGLDEYDACATSSGQTGTSETDGHQGGPADEGDASVGRHSHAGDRPVYDTASSDTAAKHTTGGAGATGATRSDLDERVTSAEGSAAAVFGRSADAPAVRLAAMRAAMAELTAYGEPGPWVDDRCPTCYRRTNRDVPGLVLGSGHPLPAVHVRRLVPTSALRRLVLAAPSQVLDYGAKTRLVPAHLRPLIWARYVTCAYDDCPIPSQQCQMDHVHSWSTVHRTRIDEIAPGCGYHNRDRADHPSKYTLHRLPDGRYRFYTTNRYRV